MVDLAPSRASIAAAQDRAAEIIHAAEAQAERIISAARVTAEADGARIRERAWALARVNADAEVMRRDRNKEKGRRPNAH